MNDRKHYQLVSDALRWMAQHQVEQPNLQQLSSAMGISPHHLQRTFQAWAGISPKQFLKSLTRQAALERLRQGSSVLEAALDSGLSGPGRLHDLTISTDALTPGEIRQQGKGVQLDYGFGDSPFGQVLVAWTARGLNFLGFCDEHGADRALSILRDQWSNAVFREDGQAASRWLDTIFSNTGGRPIPLWLRGSPFQLRVWQALLDIPEGTHASYGQLASRIGQAGASRAVGSAVGSNPIAWIIPCHRVIRQVGETGGYRWGGLTKQAMIGFEAASAAA